MAGVWTLLLWAVVTECWVLFITGLGRSFTSSVDTRFITMSTKGTVYTDIASGDPCIIHANNVPSRIFPKVYVLAWSCQAGKFGDSCSYSCHCGHSCNQTTGICAGNCDPCWLGGICQKENIAYKKRATTSSGIHSPAWSADKAVDGNRDQEINHNSCSHASDPPSVWTVDLGQQYRIHDVRIYNRDGYHERIQSAVLSLSNSSSSTSGVPCYTFPRNTIEGNSVYDVICDGRGRYFAITHWTELLNICEVEIYVCSQGSFGTDCNHFCHCSDGPCDGVSGICAGDCRPGWRGQNCSIECDQDHYGVNCNETCGNRNCATNTSSCDRRTGSCDTGCLPGWTAVDCTQECSPATYGQNCNKQCTMRNCAGNSSCDHSTGSCVPGCKAGWMGIDCVEACDAERYGANCEKVCASRQCRASSSCNSAGDCDSGCETGWTLNDCTEETRCLQSAGYNAGHLPVAVAIAFVAGAVVGAVVSAVVSRRRNRRPHKTSESHPDRASNAQTNQSQSSDDGGPESRTYDSLNAETYNSKMTAETYCTIKSGNTDSETHATTSRNESESVGAQTYETLHHTSRAMDGEYSEICKSN